MKVLCILPFLLPVLVSAELRTVLGLPRTEAIALPVLAALAAVAFWRGDRSKSTPGASPAASFFAAVAALGASAVLPSPIREAAWVTAATFAAAGLRLRGAATATVVALAGLGATVAHWFLPMAMVYLQPDAAVASFASGVLSLFGVDAPATERGVAFSPEGVATLELGTSWTHWGARELLALAAGAVTAVLAGRHVGLRARHLGWFALALLSGAVVHFAVNALVLLETRQPGALIDPWLRSVSIGIPMVWILLRASGGSDPEPAPPAAVPAVRHGVSFAAVASGLALLVLATLWPGVGEQRGTRVAIDEGHSFWERLDIPLERETFGTLTVYNYAEWVRGLEHRYGPVARLNEALSDEVLAAYDALILKTPTSPYTDDEIAAIHRFVEGGGGVYMVGDHNDVFGMNTILNSVATEYGIEYRPDALGEIDYEGGQVVDTRGLPPHPITRTMKPMHYMTSCSLALSKGARPILWMNNGFADDPDFAKNNFIGDGKLVGAETLAPLAQLASARRGKGKVLAFTDSTLFSNFSIYFPGVRELAFGGVDWLLWSESTPGWRPVALGFGAVALVLGAFALRRHGLTVAAAALVGASPAFVLADLGSRDVLADWSHALDGQETVFDTTISAGRLPIWHESHDETRDNFWGLFTAFQRSGDLMRVALEDQEVFSGRASIFVWPKRPLSEEFVARAEAFVANGGALYVFDDRLAEGSASNELLAPFGLELAHPAAGRSFTRLDRGMDSERSVTLDSSAVVYGGEPWLLDDEGDPLIARASHGEGMVVAAGLAEELSSARMATSGELRDTRGYELIQVLYAAIDAARVADWPGVVAP